MPYFLNVMRAALSTAEYGPFKVSYVFVCSNTFIRLEGRNYETAKKERKKLF